jgi:outer membrane immunogenic protein
MGRGRSLKKLLLAGTAVSTLTLVCPAFAADLPASAPVYKAPVAAPAFSWAGFYLGIQGGGIWGRSDHSSSSGDITNSFNLHGGSVGAEYGTNWQFGHWVLGMESDYSYLSLKGSAPEIFNPNPGFTATTQQNYLGMSRVRVGYAEDRLLVYATGGLADGYVQASSSGPAGSISDTQFRWGWNAGGGVEWAFAPQWSAKIEYIHADLGKASYLTPESSPFLDRANGVSLTEDMVRVGLNYHYDLPGLLLRTITGH